MNRNQTYQTMFGNLMQPFLSHHAGHQPDLLDVGGKDHGAAEGGADTLEA